MLSYRHGFHAGNHADVLKAISILMPEPEATLWTAISAIKPGNTTPALKRL